MKTSIDLYLLNDDLRVKLQRNIDVSHTHMSFDDVEYESLLLEKIIEISVHIFHLHFFC